MKKKAFTIMEILIVVVIIGILATLGLPTYQNVIEDSKAKVCETNLEALNTSLEIYAMEHDVMPGDLSELSPEHIQKAYTRILQEKGAWKIKLAYFIVGWEQRGLAYAGLLNDIASGNKVLITCPAAAPGTRSYGLNSILLHMTSQAYRNLSSDTLFIGDCENVTFTNFTDLKEIHKHYGILTRDTYAQAIGKDKKVKVKKGGSVTPKGNRYGRQSAVNIDKGKDNNNDDNNDNDD